MFYLIIEALKKTQGQNFFHVSESGRIYKKVPHSIEMTASHCQSSCHYDPMESGDFSLLLHSEHDEDSMFFIDFVLNLYLG